MTRDAVWARLKPLLAAGALLAVGYPVWRNFAVQRPLVSWYFPRLATTWGLTLLFALASLAIGVRVVQALTGRVQRDGFWALSFATGVFCFGASMGVLGHLQLFSPTLFWVLPLALLLVGWGPLADALAEGRERWARQPPLSAVEVVGVAFGVVGLLLALVPLMAPENINYDARWYHLGIAERYAVQGGIVSSPDGNHLLSGPHLASLLYTWSFLREGTNTFDRVLLATHLEAACFLGTLALVPPLTRAFAPAGSTARYRLSWVAVFLFPSLYIYDTGLMGGADHVATLWAPAALLTLFQARERVELRSWALFGLCLGALALTKYTSIIVVAPLVLWALLVPVPPGTLRQRAWGVLRGPLTAGAVSLAVTSLHWLRNCVFYGNPVYPLAVRLFPGTTPWTPESAIWHARYSRELFVPSDARLLTRLDELVGALWGYHVDLYTWRDFTAGLPVFGSLYAISLVLLPFVRGVKRLWLLAVAVHLGIALWFTLAHQMRYLILFVPLMSAACVVLASEAWKWGSLPVRGALVAVVGLQVVGAGDAPFAPTHRLGPKTAPLSRAVTFLGRGLAEENAARFTLFKEWEELGAQLPPKATLLVHGIHPTLGLNRVTLTDAPGIQYGLSYGTLGSVRAIYQRLQELGVTHVGTVDVVSQPDSVEGELLFRALFATATAERKSLHGWILAELAPAAPPEPAHRVLYLGCGNSYETGLYRLEDLNAPVVPSNQDQVWKAAHEEGAPQELLARANYVVVEEGCPPPVSTEPAFQYAGKQDLGPIKRLYYLRRVPVP